ncbi:hypothetical protein C922_05215 [Plasmodium inui San Antonio 1]|uniref:Uncharacterized protein n=1 Tax=Plasmodium inui San Antonio 1 TaxID=1237626 RepID=W7A5M5_9APIC|nr:hypothetical protein C922_05215 [Plasmodium inui San Antonio 1]EUD64394.1 hypothetical protein C922_05215 [Plasmodium inui San Antonio 1]
MNEGFSGVLDAESSQSPCRQQRRNIEEGATSRVPLQPKNLLWIPFWDSTLGLRRKNPIANRGIL